MNWLEVTFWACAGLMVYIDLGYPGLMWGAAHLRTRHRPKRSERPVVTVIIPAHNEAGVLEVKIKNTLEINYPSDRLEIIVASDGSSDETAASARQFEHAGVKVLDLPRGGKSSALNAAVAESTGDVLCLCDANVMFQPDALARLVDWLAIPDVGAVTGDVRLASHESDFGSGESLYYRIERQIQLGETRIGSVIGVDGGMYVIRRELFSPVPADTLLDDFTIAIGVIQQGFRVAYEPSAVATENGTPNSAAEFRRRVRVAAGAVQSFKRGVWPPLVRPVVVWQYLSHKFLRWAGSYLAVILLLTSIALAGAMPVYKIALAVQLIVISFALMATVSVRFRRTALGGVPFYYALSSVATIVGHVQGLFDLHPRTWERTERSSRHISVAHLDNTPACGGRS